MARIVKVIWVRREGKYFCAWGWTGTSLICADLPVGQIARRPFDLTPRVPNSRHHAKENRLMNFLQLQFQVPWRAPG
jgi:hypothetical protein